MTTRKINIFSFSEIFSFSLELLETRSRIVFARDVVPVKTSENIASSPLYNYTRGERHSRRASSRELRLSIHPALILHFARRILQILDELQKSLRERENLGGHLGKMFHLRGKLGCVREAVLSEVLLVTWSQCSNPLNVAGVRRVAGGGKISQPFEK